MDYASLKDYFYALRHIYGAWTIEYAQRVISGLPKLSYVTDFRHFLLEGPVLLSNPETVQWVTDYIEHQLPLQERSLSKKDRNRIQAYQLLDGSQQHFKATER